MTLAAACQLLLLTQPQGKSRFAADDEGPLATTPDQLIAISRGTTRILGPLHGDGYVDYVAALNQLIGRRSRAQGKWGSGVLASVGPGTDTWSAWSSPARKGPVLRSPGHGGAFL